MYIYIHIGLLARGFSWGWVVDDPGVAATLGLGLHKQVNPLTLLILFALVEILALLAVLARRPRYQSRLSRRARHGVLRGQVRQGLRRGRPLAGPCRRVCNAALRARLEPRCVSPRRQEQKENVFLLTHGMPQNQNLWISAVKMLVEIQTFKIRDPNVEGGRKWKLEKQK